LAKNKETNWRSEEVNRTAANHLS